VGSIDGDNSEIGERGVSHLDLINDISFHLGFVQVNLSGGQKARGEHLDSHICLHSLLTDLVF
jgi:hypothetical protein